MSAEGRFNDEIVVGLRVGGVGEWENVAYTERVERGFVLDLCCVCGKVFVFEFGGVALLGGVWFLDVRCLGGVLVLWAVVLWFVVLWFWFGGGLVLLGSVGSLDVVVVGVWLVSVFVGVVGLCSGWLGVGCFERVVTVLVWWWSVDGGWLAVGCLVYGMLVYVLVLGKVLGLWWLGEGVSGVWVGVIGCVGGCGGCGGGCVGVAYLAVVLFGRVVVEMRVECGGCWLLVLVGGSGGVVGLGCVWVVEFLLGDVLLVVVVVCEVWVVVVGCGLVLVLVGVGGFTSRDVVCGFGGVGGLKSVLCVRAGIDGLECRVGGGLEMSLECGLVGGVLWVSLWWYSVELSG
ncbi:hypothetical protein Tco_0631820 [Tanacetum coccineum]